MRSIRAAPEGTLVVATLAQVGDPGPERGVAVEAPELLLLGQAGDELAELSIAPSGVPLGPLVSSDGHRVLLGRSAERATA